jgi:hypothetical protein
METNVDAQVRTTLTAARDALSRLRETGYREPVKMVGGDVVVCDDKQEAIIRAFVALEDLLD